MKLTVDVSERDATILEGEARAANMPVDQYLQRLIAKALKQKAVANLERHLDYMAAQVHPDTTTEQMEAALDEALLHVRPERRWAT